MTRLGSPGLSSHSVLGFSGRKGPKKPEADRDDTPGLPRRVIPVRFRFLGPESALVGPEIEQKLAESSKT